MASIEPAELMSRVKNGSATCALCHEAIRPDADVVVSPDFIAEDSDPFFRFSNAAMHRACFAVWDSRKVFVVRFNRIAGQLRRADGSYLHMTAEGDLIPRTGRPPRKPPPPT
ncbi:MAG TPA: hypothetical protein VL287_02010 [Gemmatimonadales bacterium]|nr:hypothetical protein [Gemmatimonadales bacterium]